MDINIHAVTATVIRCTSRKNKQLLNNLIEGHTYSKTELCTLLPSILPTPMDSEITLSEQQALVTALTNAFFIYQHSKCTSSDEYFKAQSLIRTVKSNFKKQRKTDKELYRKAVKVNLTESEYRYLHEVKDSYNYKTASHFLRDVITNKLTVKPKQCPEIAEYFKATKQLSNTLESLTEQAYLLDDPSFQIQVIKALATLKDNLYETRNIAIDSHNTHTAELLAMQFLDSHSLRELYRNKLELEDTEL